MSSRRSIPSCLVSLIGTFVLWWASTGAALAAALPITIDAQGPGPLTSRWLIGQSEGFFTVGANTTPANRLLSGTTVVAIDDIANISMAVQVCASLPCDGNNPTARRIVDADGQVTVSPDGKSVSTDPQTMFGLTVTYTFTAIDGPGVMRGLLKFQNPTANAVTIGVTPSYNLSFQDVVAASSSGNTVFDTADRWVIARRGFVTNPPTTVDTMVWFGPGTPLSTPVTVSKGADIYQASFSVTVPAGETVYFLRFLAMSLDQASALASVGMFDTVTPGSVLVADLTAAQLSRVVNWDFPPAVTANAGADQTVDEASLVVLDGSGSAGEDLSYAWTQLAGPPVMLSGANTASPSFMAPSLPGGFGAQTVTFELVVSSGSQSAADTVDVTVRNVNHAPVADAGADQAVNEGSLVGLSGSLSFDPDNDALTYHWIQTGGTPVVLGGANTSAPSFTAPLLTGGVGGAATLTFELTVSDGALSHSDTVAVTVEQVNHAPTADAGAPQTVHSGAPVTLDASGSGDPDGDGLGFSWLQVAGPAVTLANSTSSAPSFTAPLIGGSATLTFRLTVSDGDLSNEDEVNVTVTNGIPRCDLALASSGLLWPPNHTMRAISIINVSDPNDEAVTITITGVTQDEPVNGTGDGDTSPDAIVQGSTALIRAERAGGGNGRVYGIAFTADDGAGGVCFGSVPVTVPKSMKPGAGAVDDGQIFDSTLP